MTRRSATLVHTQQRRIHMRWTPDNFVVSFPYWRRYIARVNVFMAWEPTNSTWILPHFNLTRFVEATIAGGWLERRNLRLFVQSQEPERFLPGNIHLDGTRFFQEDHHQVVRAVTSLAARALFGAPAVVTPEGTQYSYDLMVPEHLTIDFPEGVLGGHQPGLFESHGQIRVDMSGQEATERYFRGQFLPYLEIVNAGTGEVTPETTSSHSMEAPIDDINSENSEDETRRLR